ncbi:carboxymuconolactone decarboxylase family protein [Photorhabdus sp. RW14-46]|uniref:carboxymuconolactone decarboxylase family protein n=1 Tax=Photorhabdus sp. RW14-46 TaxID=2100168 RepID=UPI0013F3A4ED|nr:carboxymuconolactone decarboxylase family protein [Photorhabdus sp. RW14-46]NHB61270.1 carboxymuconolactone decarboxylase [Photorhabdus sp. RW14-46]
MSLLTLHTIATTPEKSKKLLQSSINDFGWIPNQSGYMSESPSLLAAYQRAHDLFIDSSLNEEEKAVVWITTGVENGCNYTVQAHGYIAIHNGVDKKTVKALIEKTDDLSPRLLALREFTIEVIYCRGQLKRSAIDLFLSRGFSKQNMLDVVLGVSQKNMSTILNSIAGTEIDDKFKLDDL